MYRSKSTQTMWYTSQSTQTPSIWIEDINNKIKLDTDIIENSIKGKEVVPLTIDTKLANWSKTINLVFNKSIEENKAEILVLSTKY